MKHAYIYAFKIMDWEATVPRNQNFLSAKKYFFGKKFEQTHDNEVVSGDGRGPYFLHIASKVFLRDFFSVEYSIHQTYILTEYVDEKMKTCTGLLFRECYAMNRISLYLVLRMTKIRQQSHGSIMIEVIAILRFK